MADETQPDTQAQSDTTPAADQNVQTAQTQDTATAPSTAESAPVSAPQASQDTPAAPSDATPADASASESAPQDPSAPADASAPADQSQPVGVVQGGSVVGSADDEPVSDDVANPAKDKAPGTVTAQPVRVDGRNRRTDEDALEGHFVEVIGKGISGAEHDHQKAVFVSVAEYDENTGYPTRALVRFKDATYEHALDVVDYADLTPARANS